MLNSKQDIDTDQTFEVKVGTLKKKTEEEDGAILQIPQQHRKIAAYHASFPWYSYVPWKMRTSAQLERFVPA